MGTRLPNDSPSRTRVRGERGLTWLGRIATLALAVAVVAAALVPYGWAMALLAAHAGGGATGILVWCLVVAMGALAVAGLASGGWAVLQHPAVRRRCGR